MGLLTSKVLYAAENLVETFWRNTFKRYDELYDEILTMQERKKLLLSTKLSKYDYVDDKKHVNWPKELVTTPRPMPHKQNNVKTSICISTENNIIREIARKLKLPIKQRFEKWDFLWSDILVSPEVWKNLLPHQRVNQFPGIKLFNNRILFQVLNDKKKLFPNDYDFFPETWKIPEQTQETWQYAKENPNSVFIVKPDPEFNKTKPTRITGNVYEICDYRNALCQVYIKNPLLIGGFKFDFQTYALMTSLNPLHLFHYKEGLARFATNSYKTPTPLNYNNKHIHFTTNPFNEFRSGESASNKIIKMSIINEILKKKGVDIDQLWKSIDSLVLKTIISVLPTLLNYYGYIINKQKLRKSPAGCQIFSFNFMLDENLKVYLLKVNRSILSSNNSPIHKVKKDLKSQLIRDTFTLLNLQNNNNKGAEYWHNCCSSGMSLQLLKENPKWKDENLTNFRIIHPCENQEIYKKYYHTVLSEPFSLRGMGDSNPNNLKKMQKSHNINSFIHLSNLRMSMDIPDTTKKKAT